MLDGPGGELRYIVFNLKTMPGNNDAQKLAIRRAVAYSVDRQSLSDAIYQDTYTPVYSMVPDGLPGHIDAFKTEFGAAPDKAKAADELTKAGVSTPVTLNIQYTTAHYGPTSPDEYGGDQAAAGEHRAVQGESAVHRVHHLLQAAPSRRLPGVPARLVPGLPGRRQLFCALPGAEQLRPRALL